MNLTKQQQTVLKLLCEGYQNKQIAHELGVCIRTVEVHRRIIMAATGAKNAVQLGIWSANNDESSRAKL